jgi:hypothetical protein
MLRVCPLNSMVSDFASLIWHIRPVLGIYELSVYLTGHGLPVWPIKVKESHNDRLKLW